MSPPSPLSSPGGGRGEGNQLLNTRFHVQRLVFNCSTEKPVLKLAMVSQAIAITMSGLVTSSQSTSSEAEE